MLRDCIRFEALTKILLLSDHFYDFFKYVEVSTFDIASDAFATFKVPSSFTKLEGNAETIIHSYIGRTY